MHRSSPLVLSLSLLLAACATPAPPRDPLPPPPASAQPGEASPSAPVIAPPTAAPERLAADDGLTVPAPERPKPAPPPDARSVDERREDRAAWDRCILKAQAREQAATSANPVGNASPEEICAKALGMARREAIPESRR